jgi:heat shock protein HslJ
MTSGLRRGSAVTVAVAAAFVMAACSGGDGPAATIDLADTSWTLSSYASPSGAETPAVVDTDGAPLTFGPDGTLSGSTGCNRFNGSYVQDGDSVTLTLGAMTEMACPGPVGDQEAAVLAALPLVRSADSTSGLVLKSDAGDVLLTYGAGLTDLAGTSWQATGINNGTGGVVSDATTPGVTAVFGTDETLTGTGGCNSYSANYTSDAGQIAIGPVAATKMACPEDVMKTESEYFAALEKATVYALEGNTLTLRDESGATQVSYRLSP